MVCRKIEVDTKSFKAVPIYPLFRRVEKHCKPLVEELLYIDISKSLQTYTYMYRCPPILFGHPALKY